MCDARASRRPSGDPTVRTVLHIAGLLLAAFALTACVSTNGPDHEDLAEVRESKSTVVLLRVVTTSNVGSLPPFEESLQSQCISVGHAAGFDATVEQVDLESFTDDTMLTGWIYLVVQPGKHVIAFAPPDMWDARADVDRWAETAHWAFEVPPDTQVVYAGTMQLHCRAEPGTISGYRIRTIRAQKLHDESPRAVALAAEHLPDLPAPVTALPKRLYTRESGLLMNQ